MASFPRTSELNMRCAGVKRLLKEAYELRDSNEFFFTKPMEDNLFEWHFTIRGPLDTVYQNGVYHGRIILPPEYPMKPPSMILLTPNGRFEVNKKICLSISGYHPETWLPSWSIRTALLALIGFMPTHSAGAIGGLECSDIERKKLALKSLDWRCNACDCKMKDILPMITESNEKVKMLNEIKALSKHSDVKPISIEKVEIIPTQSNDISNNTIQTNKNDTTLIGAQGTLSLNASQKTENQLIFNNNENNSQSEIISNPVENFAQSIQYNFFSLSWIIFFTVMIFTLLCRRIFT